MAFDTPDEFVNAWINRFTTDYSYKNPTYARGVLHVILGRILVNQRIIKRGSETRPRVSMFYLQGASSGKSSAYPMIYKVMEELNVEVMSPDELSDAALVGTVERVLDEDGNETWEDQEGVLAETELFHFDEASVLINPKKYQQNIMTYLQKALNPIGSEQNAITKKLAHGDEITIRPNCSLLLTSYMPENLEETVLNTGFLQRMIVVPRELSIEDRMEQIEMDIDALGEDSNVASLDELIEELKLIKRHYTDTIYDFDWSRAKPVIKKFARDMMEVVRDTSREARKILTSFVPRQIEQMYRIALHYCCLRRDTKVKPSDVKHAARLVLKSFHMIVHWIEDNPSFNEDNDGKRDSAKRFRGLTQVLNENEPSRGGYYSVPLIMDDLKQTWNVSQTSCYKWLNRFEDKNWIHVERSNGQKYIKPRNQ